MIHHECFKSNCHCYLFILADEWSILVVNEILFHCIGSWICSFVAAMCGNELVRLNIFVVLSLNCYFLFYLRSTHLNLLYIHNIHWLAALWSSVLHFQSKSNILRILNSSKFQIVPKLYLQKRELISPFVYYYPLQLVGVFLSCLKISPSFVNVLLKWWSGNANLNSTKYTCGCNYVYICEVDGLRML